MSNPILPPATIGILGSGQLGKMLAIAARIMGYRVHVLSPRPEPTPTGVLADRVFTAAYNDLDIVRSFAQSVDVVTYEFENVPAETAAACQQFAPLHPGAQALHVAQNRQREKDFFTGQGLPTVPYAHVNALDDLEAALQTIGTPAILKTATSGYDGKGQVKIANDQPPQSPISNLQSLATEAWNQIGQQPAILEGFANFEREVSVVAARGQNGRFAHYSLIHNDHTNHILDVSTAPADVPSVVVHDAIEMARTVLEGLDVIGVLCVEFFLTADGKLHVNEIAPRPHNSGHLTIEACTTSQFEQQLRSICGLPLGDTSYRRPAAMANLLGDLWPENRYKETKEQRVKERQENQSPDWTAVLTDPDIKLHLYGKQQARPGRKMGHITALADSGAEAAQLVRQARKRLEIRD